MSWTLAATAQTTNVAQPAGGPATRPANVQPLTAVVVKITGKVEAAEVTADGKTTWREVKVRDKLPAGTLLRTGNRARALLTFGDNVVTMVQPVSSMAIAESETSGSSQRTKLSLGYGAVRAGVAEGAVESDMTIETPAATLSRRGTWNFGIEYEAGTERFRVFVDDHGLVEALNRLTNERRRVEGGQYVTQAMIRWIETAKFDRYLPVQDWVGMKGRDLTFNEMNDTGRTVAVVGGGSGTWGTLGLGAPANTVGGGTSPGVGAGLPVTIPTEPVRINRPEGDFGTGGVGPLGTLGPKQARPLTPTAGRRR
jgi:hypothetical protein